MCRYPVIKRVKYESSIPVRAIHAEISHVSSLHPGSLSEKENDHLPADLDTKSLIFRRNLGLIWCRDQAAQYRFVNVRGGYTDPPYQDKSSGYE